MGSVLAGLVGAAATGANMAYDYYTFDRDNAEYDRRQSELFRMSQEAQRNAAANEVAGLKLAGLSPVMANGAAAAPLPSAPAPQRQPVQLETAALSNLAAQTQLINSQTKKNNAEADEIEQRVGEKQNAGMSWSRNLVNLYNRMAEKTTDENQKDYYLSMAKEAENAGVFATGPAESLKGFQQLEAEGYESRERILRSRLGSLVAEGQYNAALPHGEFYEALRDLPARESNKVIAEIAKFAADKENLEALKAVATSQKDLNEAQRKQVEAMAAKLEDYNLPALLKKGDYKGFAAAVIGLVIEGISRGSLR